jgi:hypothetical protein
MSDEYRVIDFACRVLKARFEIVRLKVGKFLENLLRRQTGSEEVEYIRDPNAQSADAGATAALGGIRGDPLEQVWHTFTLARWGRVAPAVLSLPRRFCAGMAFTYRFCECG